MQDKSQRPVFHDPKNRRWRWVRGALLVLGAAASVAFGVAAVSVLVSPALPSLGIKSPRMLPGPGHLAPPPHKPWVLDARERAYQRAKGELADAKVAAAGKGKLPERAEGAPQLSAFYVNWDDTSFTSLKMNLMSLDRLTAEWLHLAGTDGSVVVDDEEKTDAVIAYVRALRPRMPVLVLINNFRSPSTGWESQTLAGMLASPTARARTIEGIVKFIGAKHLQGVNVDFESVPKKSYGDLVLFMGELHEACQPLGYEVAQSVPAEEEGWPYARLARCADHLVLMAYDEHDAGSEPGPVASQGWFLKCVRARIAEVGAEKVVVALGNYGYDWRQGDAEGTEKSFQEAVLTAEESEGKISLDPVALNPAFDYYDEKDALHHVWFLNAVTLYNELVATGPLKPHGYALWRLGSEDPSVWNIYGRRKTLGREQALSLETMHYGYDLDYEGKGEVLKVAATPRDGRRVLHYDDATGLIDQERLVSFPSPYVLQRWGGQDPKKIALTFDDGPDADYTPQILDILKAKHAPATFFVVGLEADRHSGLLKRMVAEGHEVGNHTFSHPNIALIPEQQFKFELNATERLFESRLGRGSVLFRPPYAEDVEPSTPEEVQPILLSSSLGYYTIGMLDDPSDWSQPGTASIVRAAVERAMRGDAHVVLLHDGGGKREQTVEALPLLIDALRAKGFKLVAISELMGLTRDEVMPPARGGSPVVRGVDDVVFIVLGGSATLLYALFLTGIVLGCARLVFIGLLAVAQRWLDHRRTFPEDFAPAVSVVIPAFNEERVVCQTVRALLASVYPNFEVIVVDDGSKDGTFAVLQESFGGEPGVRLITKANEGKARALNEGIAHASGDIIVALDADTLFLPDTLAMLVRRFSDPEVGAVAGNAKVGNRLNLHTYYQALEYITSQNMDRRALDVLNCITVVPGSVGAWRKSLVLAAGGFTSATLAEDADLTLSILERGNKVAYEDAAVAYTEAPDTVRDFVKQRFRWMYGTLQAAWKHRRVLFRPRYGALGLFALPNVFLFQVIFPLISPVLDLFVVASLLFTVVQERFHPNGDALHAFLHILFYYSIFLAVDASASVLAFLLERDEEWSLLLWLPLQRFIYRQLMYWVAMKSVYAAIKGRRVGWGQLERKATVGS
jgi:peptidoglycan-N-acetylglucosamine deacetylase